MSTVNSHLFHRTVARSESASCEASRLHRTASRLEDDPRAAAGVQNATETGRGRCKPRFRASGRNVGQRRAVSGALMGPSEVEIDAVGAGV